MREEVKWFAEQMESKLQENDHKGGWKNCKTYWLLEGLHAEINELKRAIDLYEDFGEERENVIKEAADVANFAMMVADLVRK